jgi:hypothetical protein
MEHPEHEWQRTQFLIALCTLSGYFSETVLHAIANRQAPERIERAKVSDEVEACLSWHRANEGQWPTSVDCDRLDAAYEALADHGVLGLHWCQGTISAGHDHATELALDMGFRGYCFFHEQDITGAIRGDGLDLAYDAAEVDRELALAIGQIVAETMSSTGLTVNWSGRLADRIELPGFAWGRRYKASLESAVLQASCL